MLSHVSSHLVNSKLVGVSVKFLMVRKFEEFSRVEQRTPSGVLLLHDARSVIKLNDETSPAMSPSVVPFQAKLP